MRRKLCWRAGRRAAFACSVLWLLSAMTASAEDRNAKVRKDRDVVQAGGGWVYNDLPQAIDVAKKSGKPLLVVIRCIPCQACAGFDEQVARKDARIRDLMDRFVCVRIVQGNSLDLELFQFDNDMSFAAFLLNADKTIYGRFGTMASRDAERELSLEGFSQALEGALALHKDYPNNRQSLAGKRGPTPRFNVPEAYPALERYGAELDYEGKVAQSCVHCHQIRDAERVFLRAEGKVFPDELLYPWPMPDRLGMKLDPLAAAKIEAIAPGSAAETAGFRAGDRLLTLAGQPLLSIADVQWVLHSAGEPASLQAEILRGDEKRTLTLPVARGWREGGDISWRPTSWDLRRMATGGLLLMDLKDEERGQANIRAESLALRVKHVGEYGAHAAAKKAGFLADDVLVEVDGKTGRMSESDLLVYLLRNKKPGESVRVVVLREGQRVELQLPMQ